MWRKVTAPSFPLSRIKIILQNFCDFGDVLKTKYIDF